MSAVNEAPLVVPMTDLELRLERLLNVLIAAAARAIQRGDYRRAAILDNRFTVAEDALIVENQRVLNQARNSEKNSVEEES
jgi:hypothetical protein